MRARTVLLLVSLPWLSACGVKAPPIAPERAPMRDQLNLDCSPTDPDCDKMDPNYKPRGR
jgi:hypothetical protein